MIYIDMDEPLPYNNRCNKARKLCSILTAAIVGCVSVKNANDNARADAKEQLELNGSLSAQELNATISRVEQSVDTLSDMVLRELDFEEFKRDKSYADVYTGAVIGEKSTEVVGTTIEGYERLRESRESVDELKVIVDQFQL